MSGEPKELQSEIKRVILDRIMHAAFPGGWDAPYRGFQDVPCGELDQLRQNITLEVFRVLREHKVIPN